MNRNRKFNKIEDCGTHLEIDVSSPACPDAVCFIDSVDCWLVNGPKYGRWSCSHGPNKTTYAKTKEIGARKTVSMHKLILHNIPLGFDVEHRDGNGLNNRRGNLRKATRSQNNANRRKTRKGIYKGVTLHKKSGKYQAVCAHKYLGLYETERLAALAYDKFARSSYGEFAKTNFTEAL